MLKKTMLIVSSLLLVVSCSTQTQTNQNQDFNTEIASTKRASKPQVTYIQSPNQNPRPDGMKIDTIVLHHTASAANATNIGKFFANPESKVSAHYTVDRTGYIVQSVNDSERSWHAGKSQFQGRADVNNFSIGIEICNIGDHKEPYPDAQYDALIKLVSYLMNEYNISEKNITRHRDIALPAGRKDDTSDNFSVDRVLQGVKEIKSGNYNPDIKPAKVQNYPDTREVKTEFKATLKEIADEFLDAESRWEELALLNPSFKESSVVPAKTTIKLPLNFKYWEQLKK
ncbi:MAG: N-acetylmuramoyl-L-alanine amidase [Candidatus Sericytochromatia bacterium]